MTTILPQVEVSYRRPANIHLQIKDSQTAYRTFLSIWNMDTIGMFEEFMVIYMDRANNALGYRMIGRGSISSCVVDPKIIFSIGLSCNCSGLILCHNHPSGNLKPSKSDRALTTRLLAAAKLLDMALLDHLIITEHGYTSFADEGWLESG